MLNGLHKRPQVTGQMNHASVYLFFIGCSFLSLENPQYTTNMLIISGVAWAQLSLKRTFMYFSAGNLGMDLQRLTLRMLSEEFRMSFQTV